MADAWQASGLQQKLDQQASQSAFEQLLGNTPGYMPGYTPGMAMAPQIQQELAGLNYDTSGLKALRANALRRGASPWARVSLQKQFLEEQDARERAKREARSGTAQAESDLAMRGGLSSGARERAATSGMRDLLSMSQDVGRQGGINRLGIGIQDEQNRIANLSQLPGQENIAFQANLQKQNTLDQARQTDVQRAIEENNRINAFNQNRYGQQLTASAAQQQAQAIENSGK